MADERGVDDMIGELERKLDSLRGEVRTDGRQKRAKLARHTDPAGHSWVSSTIRTREFLSWCVAFLVAFGAIVAGTTRLVLDPHIRDVAAGVVLPAIDEHATASRLKMMAEVKNYVTVPEFNDLRREVERDRAQRDAQYDEILRVTQDIRTDLRALRGR
jgi:hypothetical protein